MSDPKPAQFRKTKTGKWAVMAPVVSLEKALKDDAGVVQVLKKSGDYSRFTVGSLGKPFDVDGVQMCYGYSPEDSADGASRPDTPSGVASAGANPGTATTGQWLSGSDSSYDDGPTTINLNEPPRDDSEPLPDFQGDSGDEWDGGF